MSILLIKSTFACFVPLFLCYLIRGLEVASISGVQRRTGLLFVLFLFNCPLLLTKTTTTTTCLTLLSLPGNPKHHIMSVWSIEVLGIPALFLSVESD
ncbi:hypothetical protein BJY04DRAFT_22905 [Aspergillus karnatakaensis]|uniref:uncharacterized protein n=1 Tax=Aspergillus karnatakaensis TaxID=1810916 RepID=UPI003CCCC667